MSWLLAQSLKACIPGDVCTEPQFPYLLYARGWEHRRRLPSKEECSLYHPATTVSLACPTRLTHSFAVPEKVLMTSVDPKDKPRGATAPAACCKHSRDTRRRTDVQVLVFIPGEGCRLSSTLGWKGRGHRKSVLAEARLSALTPGPSGHSWGPAPTPGRPVSLAGLDRPTHTLARQAGMEVPPAPGGLFLQPGQPQTHWFFCVHNTGSPQPAASLPLPANSCLLPPPSPGSLFSLTPPTS